MLHSVEICKFFPHDFLQKFRQINFFTKELYCKSIWRKIFAVGENFWNFHTVDQFHEFFRHFDGFFGVFTKILKFREINYVFAIVCIWISFVSVLVLLLKFIRIGLLTNRLGRNKIPYHLGNYSFPCGFAARERIISLVVRNFIPTRAIGQESYICKQTADSWP